ncbi:Subtilisin-like protease [Vigna angularis]|uniref:Subtilisin-like protease n=1 Tax=Phaseolus angularis TaxID=3914 RepID=A0A8T0LGF9_PHAAN|nr:Subtilisin-like protease [Vigna angularis]
MYQAAVATQEMRGSDYLGFILVAFDVAVADDVDMVSLRVGGVVVSYHLDEIAIGAFGATLAGVFVPPQLAMAVPVASQ